MKTSENVLKDQEKGLPFNDVVAKYFNVINEEVPISKTNDRKYEAIWVFRDNSKLKLNGFHFCEI